MIGMRSDGEAGLGPAARPELIQPEPMRILLIEDDTMIGKAVRRGLADAGFAIDWVTDGRAAELALDNAVYDLVVLDIGLPKKDGMAILATLRGKGNAMPVLIASARDTVRDRIAGLEAGADDYVLKPFDMDELVARVRALLRRHVGSGSPLLRFGALVLDPLRKLVTQGEESIDLSAREFAVLEALMQRPGAVLSRAQLEESVYGWGDEVGSNAIEVHLHHLRKKLGAGVIKNVRGVGYRVTEG
jgi:two-component system response regulator QseB